MSIAQWGFIQSVYETAELQNPDTCARYFLPRLQRWRCAWLSQRKLATLRSNPLYYYLVARTRYYDEIFLDAISDKQHIINIGCGYDTRAYRFEPVLQQHGVKVLECDLPEAIIGKEHLAKRQGTFEHVAYMPIDLNNRAWPELECWLHKNYRARILVLMEGVSPYVNIDTFNRFLSLLARELPIGSRVAYDFKLEGVADSFGRGGRTQRPFRLPTERAEVVRHHENLGCRVNYLEGSSECSGRYLTGLARPGGPCFREDGLLQLEVRRHAVTNRMIEAAGIGCSTIPSCEVLFRCYSGRSTLSRTLQLGETPRAGGV